ncbi:MAG: hypothetical protein KIS96_03370 [Bauldia sp.]|nr:hypothetical protein [Bauldia sp.]
MSGRTPEQVIARLAEIAEVVAWQAGVGGMELAGMFVSVLARHPELMVRRPPGISFPAFLRTSPSSRPCRRPEKPSSARSGGSKMKSPNAVN